jgi:hypothetical protein
VFIVTNAAISWPLSSGCSSPSPSASAPAHVASTTQRDVSSTASSFRPPTWIDLSEAAIGGLR